MAARVTASDIQGIMPDYPDSLTAFIATATLIVDEELVGTGQSDARLTQIELYLACHFAAHKTPLTTQEMVSKVQVALQRNSPGKNFGSTQYGQTAMALDASGKLKALSDGQGGSMYFEGVQEDWQGIAEDD